jgi:molybdopterin-guanine dinucleotide biosynthesis protein B
MGKLIPIIGSKNQGKTTLVVALVKEFKHRGYQVGTIKETSHDHSFDTEGKDSYLHREAGAEPSAVVSNDSAALYFTPQSNNGALRKLASNFNLCDYIFLEGWKRFKAPKIEVWRAETKKIPLANKDTDIILVVGDMPPGLDMAAYLPLDNIAAIADYILENKTMFKEYA